MKPFVGIDAGDDCRDGEYEQREAYLERLAADISPEEVEESLHDDEEDDWPG
jgi:hypothetical protein